MTEVVFKKNAPLWVRADYVEETSGISDVADLMRLPMQCAQELGVPETRYIKLAGKVGIEFVLIPHGVGYLGDKCDQEFKFPRPVYMSKYPITEEQYFSVTGKKPSAVRVKNAPVDSVNWHEAREFAEKIGCRLPYEAEWEYACRAGTKTRYSLGDEWSKEWGNCNSSRKTPVGTFMPNYWNLYDMHGNVWEWCEDDWDSNGIKQPPIREGEQRGPLESCAGGPGASIQCTSSPPTDSALRHRASAASLDSDSSSEGEQRGPFGSCGEVPGAAIPCTVSRPTETMSCHRTATEVLGSDSSSEGEQRGPFGSFGEVAGVAFQLTAARLAATSIMWRTEAASLVSDSSSEGEQRGPFGSCGVGRGTSIHRAVDRPSATTLCPSTATSALVSDSSSEGEQRGDFRLLRGGSWYSFTVYCSAAYRNNYVVPSYSNFSFGFRIVLGG